MAITVISYAPVGHSYFHTPSPLRGTPSILEGEFASRSTASRSAFDGKETAPPLSGAPSGELEMDFLAERGGCSVGAGAYDTNLTVTGAYDHFAGSVICANIYIIAKFYINCKLCCIRHKCI